LRGGSSKSVIFQKQKGKGLGEKAKGFYHVSQNLPNRIILPNFDMLSSHLIEI